MINRFGSLQDAIVSIAGQGSEVQEFHPVSGGDINSAFCLTLTDGKKLFLKTNHSADKSFFQAEADGLQAIAASGTISVPKVFGCGHDASHGGCEFLLMEYLESPRRVKDYWERFGHELAAMHRADTAALCGAGRFGFPKDNYIGQNRQINSPSASWTEFFRDCRLIPQARMAEGYFDESDRKSLLRLLDHLDRYLAEPERPSLLHGDLWSGNAMEGNDGCAWLIDPAVYVGNSEADRAMTELFGGFPESFYRSYEEVNPLQSGYEERRDIYNLYHLLNHTNLFGAGYFSAVRNILRRF